LHVAVRHQWPGFTPPATPDKPSWMRISLYGEFGVHITFLGAVITGIRNRVPCLKNPRYNDDGIQDIRSTEPLISTDPNWGEIAIIIVEFATYLAIWAWIYQLI
jgi:hypothetical protein